MFMRTPLLFAPSELPKKGPRLNAQLIKEHQMWIHDSGRKEPGRWIGFSETRARKALSGHLDGTETCYDIFARYCRLLDDMGLLVSADSKNQLIQAIAQGIEPQEA